MKYSIVFVCLVITSLSGYTNCKKVKKLERQLVKLAGRQALDSIAREELNERLASVEKALTSLTKQDKCCEKITQSSDKPTPLGTRESFVDKEDFLRLAKALKDEKAASRRIRKHVTTKVKSLDIHVKNVSHDLESISEMCLATESHTVNTLTESMKSEVENISQAVQITKAEIADAIDKVQESLDTHIGDTSESVSIWNEFHSLKDELEKFGKSIKSLSDRIGQIENSRNTTPTKLPVDRLETIWRTVATTSPEILERSCLDHYKKGSRKDGVYTVYPKDYGTSIQVYCDMTTDGGGWTVFQRRKEDEHVDFFRDWKQYKHGFGNVTGEFWLGNDNIAALTNPCCHELRIELEDSDNNRKYATYGKFNILPEHENYKLYVDLYSGNAGDSLEYHNTMLFSTKDRDNDMDSRHCAEICKGGWWYNGCFTANLNGDNGVIVTPCGHWIEWYGWLGRSKLSMTEMKLR